MALPKHRMSSYYGGFPDGVKWLIACNTVIFVLLFLGGEPVWQHLKLLSLVPALTVNQFPYFVWQLFTYMFLHRTLMHWLFNMLALWMFGTPIEQDWGTRRFLKYYLLCGVAAGCCDALLRMFVGDPSIGTIGASGAIYGLLVAFGVLYPEAPVLMFLLFPMKAKYMVMIFAGIEFLMALGPNTGVSNFAHLGGMAFGYLYIKRRLPSVKLPDFGGAYRQWKLKRAKRKFQVYLRKSGGRGPWVN